MKANKFMLAGMLVAALAMVGCKPTNTPDTPNNGGDGQDTTVVEEPTIEEMPELAAPGAGKVTIAVRVPENTTNGVWIVGGFTDSWKMLQEVAEPSLYRFTRVEGTKTWWQITVDFDASAQFKFLPICKNAEGNEYTAWAVEPTGMRQMFDNEPADESDFNKDNQSMGAAEDAVVFFEVKGWSVDPSVVFMPAGTYKFLITLNKIDTLPIPAGDVVLTGNFKEGEGEWGTSTRVMKQVSDDATAVVYEYEDVVPDYFCFKVFVQDGESQTWANGENVPLSVDVVKDGVASYDGFTFPAPAPAE